VLPLVNSVSDKGEFVFHSEEQSRLAARKYARVVQKLGFPVSGLDIGGR